MRAAVLREVGKPMSIETVDVADPGPGEVLVEVAATAICHSDLHFLQGHLPVQVPAILGHETAGIVRKAGLGVSYLKPGDHVIGCLSAFCGSCELDLRGAGRVGAQVGRDATPVARGPAGDAVHASVRFRRDDAGARACAGEDRHDHAA